MTIRTLDKHPQPRLRRRLERRRQLRRHRRRVGPHLDPATSLTGKKVREYRTHTRGIQKLSFNLTGTLLASTGKDDQVNVYDLQSPSIKEKVAILGKGVNFYGATFHPKLPYTFAVGMLGGGVRLYDAPTGKVTGFLTDAGGRGIMDCAWNDSGTRCVSAGRRRRRRRCGTPRPKRKARQAQGPPGPGLVRAAMSPNGQLVATSSSDRTVCVWDAKTLAKVAELPNEFAVGSPLCFTADGGLARLGDRRGRPPVQHGHPRPGGGPDSGQGADDQEADAGEEAPPGIEPPRSVAGLTAFPPSRSTRTK